MRLVQRPLLWLPAALVVVGCVAAAAAAPLGPAGLLPRPVATVAVLLALGLLVESFGRQVHWRWRTRHRAGTRALVNVRRAGVTGLRTAAGMALWPSPTRVRAAYGTAVEYSLRSLLSFVTHHADCDTVLVVLGDHQPATIVSGRDAVHDVPVTIIARDRSVLAAIDGWHWSPGLIPAREGQAWRMDRFRDRFLAAFAR